MLTQRRVPRLPDDSSSIGGRRAVELAELLRTQVANDGPAREEVNVKQKRIFDINCSNYGVGCRAESDRVFVRWFGQSTNQLR